MREGVGEHVVEDAGAAAGIPVAQLVDLALVGQLAAQFDHAVVDVDGDRALGDVGGAEQLGLFRAPA